MFWIKLQTTTSITSNDSINNILKAGEDKMKTIQNSTIIVYACGVYVSDLDVLVWWGVLTMQYQPPSKSKQGSDHQDTTDTQSSMKTQGYTWAHSGTRQVTIKREPAAPGASTPDFPWRWKSECPRGSHGSTIHGHPGQPHTHSVVELAEFQGWDSSRWEHNGPSNPTTRRAHGLQRWRWYLNESTVNHTSWESQVSSTLWY